MRITFLVVFLLPIAAATIKLFPPQSTLQAHTTIDFQPEGGYTSILDSEGDSEVHLLFESIPAPSAPASTLTLKAIPTTVYRPESFEAIEHAQYSSYFEGKTIPLRWNEIPLFGPDVTDRHTLAQLARMSANAYQLPGRKKWYELDDAWNINASFPFGWDNAEDGFRGFVFRSRDNSTIVLSIKGTTLQGPTSRKDKLNDNLLFSCCCAHVDFSPCLSAALIQESLFYSTGVKLVKDLRTLYPFANIWLVGHSLGGSLASLLGSTFGLPTVAFEAPGERLAAHRLRLPLPPPNYPPGLPRVPVTHVYHNADPIPQGACTGAASLCAQAGYALETRCHLGKTIVYDTVGRLGWHVDVRKHVIQEMILKVLDIEGPWPNGDNGEQQDVPTAQEEVDCVDCFKWEFGHFKKST